MEVGLHKDLQILRMVLDTMADGICTVDARDCNLWLRGASVYGRIPPTAASRHAARQ